MPPTRQGLTQGQWCDGRLLWGLRVEPWLEPCLTMLVIITHPTVAQPKLGAFLPRICSWLWTMLRAEARRLSFVLKGSRKLFHSSHFPDLQKWKVNISCSLVPNPRHFYYYFGGKEGTYPFAMDTLNQFYAPHRQGVICINNRY